MTVAPRMAARAEGGGILTASVVRQLAMAKGFLPSEGGDVVVRGFKGPVKLRGVRWLEGG